VVIGVDRLAGRLAMSSQIGADQVVDASRVDPVKEILRLTGGRGVDVAIDALGTQARFEAALRVLRPGGTLSGLGVYSTDLTIPLVAFADGLGDHKIITTLCPGGQERMRRLMSVIAIGRVDLGAVVTYCFKLADIEAAYDLLVQQRDGVLKVAITPCAAGGGPVGPRCPGKLALLPSRHYQKLATPEGGHLFRNRW
jgi:alcohol dehydrogenase